MLGTVELLWLMLTLCVSSVHIIASIQPNWVINPFTHDTYGLLTLCTTTNTRWPLDHASQSSSSESLLLYKQRLNPYSRHHQRMCTFHDSEFVYLTFPSLTWSLCVVLYTIACVFMCLSAFVGLGSALFLERDTREKIAKAASFTQGIAILLSAITVSTFPVVFGSEQSTLTCGQTARTYFLGNCQLGWSYMLAIAGTAIGAFCPYLAQHIDVFLEGIDSQNTGVTTNNMTGAVSNVDNILARYPHQSNNDDDEGPCVQVTRTDSFKSTSTFSSFISI